MEDPLSILNSAKIKYATWLPFALPPEAPSARCISCSAQQKHKAINAYGTLQWPLHRQVQSRRQETTGKKQETSEILFFVLSRKQHELQRLSDSTLQSRQGKLRNPHQAGTVSLQILFIFLMANHQLIAHRALCWSIEMGSLASTMLCSQMKSLLTSKKGNVPTNQISCTPQYFPSIVLIEVNTKQQNLQDLQSRGSSQKNHWIGWSATYCCRTQGKSRQEASGNG